MTKHKRQSTIDALNKYYERQLPNNSPQAPRRKNEKPEKDVEKDCVKWMRDHGWSVNIFEAKATYSPEAGRYIQQGMKAGTCDCIGNTDLGVAVAIEFKALGKLSTFNREDNFRQRNFIVTKINSNAFACVVDSVDRLSSIYLRWMELKSDAGAARNYLLSMLPQVSEKTRLKGERLFDDDSD